MYADKSICTAILAYHSDISNVEVCTKSACWARNKKKKKQNKKKFK